MASSSSSSFMGLLVVLVVAALLQCATAVTYTVGDTTGWTIPSGGAQFYSNWAGGKTFVVGDILSFNFVPQSHDVATVTKAQNDACTSEGNIIRTSPANITLSTAGNHYFICTFSGHCAAGQKLTINVVSSSTATPATPPTVSADGPSPPPTSGDSTFPNDAPSLFTGFGTAGGNGNEDNKKRIIVIGISTGAGCFLLAGFLFLLIRTNSSGWSRRNWKKKTNNAGDGRDVEEFLEIYGSLALRRYTYSDLKKITNSFKDSLGQGGYGGVFKGMLQDGRLVAVKVLNESKGNGEDFINEVSSIGRTYHVNIVSLLGFCSEGSKRALIYEFMPNGSLEKFIYTDKPGQSHPLGWEKLYQIAIGVARGLEYLHRGCSTRILHFDIKPHNILLDQDFCPKISDFGLAKLCPTQNSIISMLGARGTFGFIAPEVYCRNIGGVSNKSDVYSYGMMVLEMVGGRKNIDPLVENTSEIYFPHWIYKRLTTYRHLDQDGYLGLHGIATKVEEETARKMILVGLWCIQTNPTDRPSMSRVVEMLEGSLDDLQMPPQPFLSSSS